MKNDEQANALREDMNAVAQMSEDELRKKYGSLFSTPADRLAESVMRWRICYRMQEIVFGGLTPEECEALVWVAKQDPKVNPDAHARKHKTPVKGVVYSRVYKGREYRLTHLGDSRYYIGDKMFRSPTEAALHVTGQHVNGKVFWGIWE